MPAPTRREILREMRRQRDDNLALDFTRYFRQAISDPDPEVRALAVGALWEDDSHQFLIQLTDRVPVEDDAAVQEAIAVALGAFSYRVEVNELDPDSADRTQRALFYLLEHGANWMVRRRALESAAYMSGDQRVKDAIRTWYASEFEQECAGALVAMGRHLDPEWYLLVRRELSNEDPDIRCEAARAAGEFGEVDIIDELAALVNDEDEEIQQVAILAIGRIGGKPAIDALRYLDTQVSEDLKELVRSALEEAEFLAESTGLEG